MRPYSTYSEIKRGKREPSSWFLCTSFEDVCSNWRWKFWIYSFLEGTPRCRAFILVTLALVWNLLGMQGQHYLSDAAGSGTAFHFFWKSTTSVVVAVSLKWVFCSGRAVLFNTTDLVQYRCNSAELSQKLFDVSADQGTHGNLRRKTFEVVEASNPIDPTLVLNTILIVKLHGGTFEALHQWKLSLSRCYFNNNNSVERSYILVPCVKF